MNISNNSSPIATTSMKNILEEPLGLEIFRLTVSSIVALFGVITNILVCGMFAYDRSLRTANNYFILNLTIADLGILLISYPLIIVKTIMKGRWPLGKFACEKLLPAQEIFQGVAFWTVAAIAVARFRGLQTCYRKTEKERKAEIRRVKFVMIGIWLVAFIVLSVPLYFVIIYVEKGNRKRCGVLWRGKETLKDIYMNMRVFLTFIVPLVFTMFTYSKVYCKIKQSTKFVKSMKAQGHISVDNKAGKALQIQRRKNKRAMRLLTPLVFVFAITVSPYNLIRLVMIYWYSQWKNWPYRVIVYNMCALFLILHAAINPVLYSVAYKNKKKALQEAISSFWTKTR